jgi:hypothetical protein
LTFTVNNATQGATQGLASFAVMGNIAVLTMTVQRTNLGIRLNSLRRGAKGISISGVSLNGLPWAVLQPTMLVEWEHQYLNNSRLISGTLVVDPTQAVFGARTKTPDRNYFNLGAGITATFKRGLSAFFFYETVVGRDNFTAHSFNAGVRFEF